MKLLIRIIGTAALIVVLVSSLTLGFLVWCQLPDHDYSLVVAPLNKAEEIIKNDLRKHVDFLAGTIGPRNLNRSPLALAKAETYITEELKSFGYDVTRQEITVNKYTTANLYTYLPGEHSDTLLVLGAHYDSFNFSPGADDNASGVAMLLQLAGLLREKPRRQDLMIVFFTNEEEPYYETRLMGSTRFVEDILSKESRNYRMVNLESVGFFTKVKGSQDYPFPLDLIYYPTGDYVGFVSNLPSRGFLKKLVSQFKKESNFPTGSSSLPEVIPGVDWSDHAAFWRAGKKAVMITDSTFLRYEHYHLPTDTPDRLDYEAMAHITIALAAIIPSL